MCYHNTGQNQVRCCENRNTTDEVCSEFTKEYRRFAEGTRLEIRQAFSGIMITHPKLQNGVFFQLGMSLRYTASMALALLVYGALAAALAARFKNPVLWGLIFVMGWESITTSPLMATAIKRLSISHYLFTLFPHYRLPRSDFSNILGTSPPSAWVALLVIFLLTAVLLWIAIRTFREREYLM